MTKPNPSNKSKIQKIFDEGSKFVCKTFVAFFIKTNTEKLDVTVIASKKVGNAVKRNRSKRRLRELVQLYIKPVFPNIKLILIARSETAIVDFPILLQDCNNLIKKIKNDNKHSN